MKRRKVKKKGRKVKGRNREKGKVKEKKKKQHSGKNFGNAGKERKLIKKREISHSQIVL